MWWTTSLTAGRWLARAPLLALAITCAVLLVAGVRSIAAPAPVATPRPSTSAPDFEAQAFAEAFARAYLSWDANQPQTHERSVAPFTSTALDAGAGAQLPRHGEQRVLSTAVRDDRRDNTRRVVTVMAATTNGEVDLAVPVARDSRGFLVVPSYPAVVGTIPTARDLQVPDGRQVDDSALAAVVRRALRNYLAGDRANLLADLAPHTLVVLPTQTYRLLDSEPTTWVVEGRRLAAVVRVRGAGGLELTLRYELRVVHTGGRWFVAGVMDPSPSRTEDQP